MLKRFLKYISTLFSSLLIITLFSLAYNYTGAHITNTERYTDYKWESKQFFSTMNEGYSWLFFDEYGFNNKYPYKDNLPLDNRDIDVLLMGSSHMEAVQISPEKNVGYLLNRTLPDNYIYNIGISGHNIYNCFKNIEFAVNKFKPRKFVIVETSTISFSVDSMEKVNNGTFPTIKSYDKGLIYFVQKTVPGIKLLYKKIDEWRKLDKNIKLTKQHSIYDDHYINTVDAFVHRAQNIVKKNGARLIIAYHPDSKIDRNGKMIETTNQSALRIFSTICKQNDVVFVDCTKAANILYSKEHQLIHGFCNSAVGVGHLNEFGHKLLATEITKAINNL